MTRHRGYWRLWPSLARRTVVALALCGGMAAQPSLAATGRPAKVAQIDAAAPEGFESLTGPQKAMVDIFLGDRRLGEVVAVYQPGSLRFESPDRVMALLPQLGDPAVVRAALAAGDLASNANRVCTAGSDLARCGQLSPEVLGIIFDEQRFRVQIFINPRLLPLAQATKIEYLPRPQSGVGLLNALSAVMSGSTRGRNIYNLQNRLLIGDADRRLRADIGYSNSFGVQADQIVAEIDRPGWRFSGGTFWTQGSSLVGRRKILGIGAATQFDTRLDKDEMRGNPLIVFLDHRAKVDILRDGRVIASRVYESGNQALDTSGLPDGSYEVVLRIEQMGGAVREERRFFTRNRQIAPMGHAIYYAYAGVLVDDLSRKFLSPTRTPFAQLGGGWRLNPHIALDANVMATNKTVVGEMGATWLSRAAQLRLGGVVSSNGTRGGFFSASSSGNSRLGFDFDLRHIAVANKSAPARAPPFQDDPLVDRDFAGLPVARRTYTQLAGSVNLSLPGGQIGIAGVWRQERGEAASYNIGPRIRWELLNRGPWNLTFRGDYAKSRGGSSGYVGLTLRFQGRQTAFSSNLGMRTIGQTGAPGRSGPVASLSGSWNREKPGGTDIELSAGYDRDLDSQSINGHASLRTMQARFDSDVIHSLGGSGGGTQYSLGLQTTLAMRGGKLSFVGKNSNESMVMVEVKGGDRNARFEVLVNEAPEGTVRGGGSLPIALTPYRQYSVRIRPLGSELLHYDGAVRQVSLYPGNITRLGWSVNRLVAMFGRLAFSDGKPVSGANIRAEGGISQSDDAGFFQIETADGAALDVALADGRSCRVQPPASNRGEAFVKLGTMICNPSIRQQPFTTALLTTAGH